MRSTECLLVVNDIASDLDKTKIKLNISTITEISRDILTKEDVINRIMSPTLTHTQLIFVDEKFGAMFYAMTIIGSV